MRHIKLTIAVAAALLLLAPFRAVAADLAASSPPTPVDPTHIGTLWALLTLFVPVAGQMLKMPQFAEIMKRVKSTRRWIVVALLVALQTFGASVLSDINWKEALMAAVPGFLSAIGAYKWVLEDTAGHSTGDPTPKPEAPKEAAK